MPNGVARESGSEDVGSSWALLINTPDSQSYTRQEDQCDKAMDMENEVRVGEKSEMTRAPWIQ